MLYVCTTVCFAFRMFRLCLDCLLASRMRNEDLRDDFFSINVYCVYLYFCYHFIKNKCSYGSMYRACVRRDMEAFSGCYVLQFVLLLEKILFDLKAENILTRPLTTHIKMMLPKLHRHNVP